MDRIIIAEDEQLFRKSLRTILEGYAEEYCVVAEASSGLEALEAIKAHHPEIVISDIKMPGMNGLELLEHTRECGEESSFVIISGYDVFEYARRALVLHAEEYLLKPLDPEELIRTLRRLTSQRIAAARKNTAIRQCLWEYVSLCQAIAEQIWRMDEARLQESLRALGERIANRNEPLPAELQTSLFASLQEYIILDLQCRFPGNEAFKETGSHHFPSTQSFDALQACCTQLAKQVLGMRNHAQNHRVRKCLQLIEANYLMENFTLADVAQALSLSPTYLSTLFKDEIGCSFSSFILQKKIAYAKQLLRSERKVYEVSESLGYADVAHFSKIFKKYTGQTPLEYRNTL